MRRVVLAVVGLVSLAVLGFAVRAAQERRAEARELEALRAELGDLRVAADSCRFEVTEGRVDFRRYERVVDSLRTRVREFEAMDGRGVPQERYEEYLETLDRYNEAVAGWDERADTLQSADDACREVIRLHNVAADSLRRRLEALEEDGG